MLLLLLAALAQPTPPPAPAVDEIEVIGERRPELRERIRRIARQVDRILPPVTTDQPYARFGDPVCPGVLGLPAAAGQAIVDRIGVVADGLGLPVGEPGCDPNLLVIVADDTAAAVRRLAGRRRANFISQSVADMRRLREEQGAARGWAETEVRSRDGERLVAGDDPPQLSVNTASRLALPFRRDIVSAVVMIDRAAVAGRDPVQVADYALMRGLAGVRADRPRDADTILSAFTPAGDATAPGGLTEVDWGILRGLYTGQGNRPSGIKRADMVRAVLAAEDGIDIDQPE